MPPHTLKEHFMEMRNGKKEEKYWGFLLQNPPGDYKIIFHNWMKKS